MANNPFKIAGIVAGAAIGLASAAYGAQRVIVRSLSNEHVDFEFHAKEQFVVHTRDGARIAVYRDGPRNDTKPTLIFLHGYALCSPIWSYQFEILRENYDIIALDLRGHGASTIGDDGVSFPTLAHDIVEVIDQLQLDRVVFVGHSTGGVAVMSYLDLFPEHVLRHVSGLCFVSTLARPPYHYLKDISDAFANSSISGIAFHTMSDIPLIGFPMMRFGLGKKASNATAEFVRRCIASTNREVCVIYLQKLTSFDYVDTLAAYVGASSVIAGSSDRVTPRKDTELVAEALGTTETIIKDVGHCPMLESPEEFNNALLDFLDMIKEP